MDAIILLNWEKHWTISSQHYEENMTWNRRRGSALIDTEKGILLVCQKNGVYMLPGGGASHAESRRSAAIRELEEETGLKAETVEYLFSINSRRKKAHGGGLLRDNHKVFSITSNGKPIPRHEIKKIAYFKPGSSILIDDITKEIIEKYYEMTKLKN